MSTSAPEVPRSWRRRAGRGGAATGGIGRPADRRRRATRRERRVDRDRSWPVGVGRTRILAAGWEAPGQALGLEACVAVGDGSADPQAQLRGHWLAREVTDAHADEAARRDLEHAARGAVGAERETARRQPGVASAHVDERDGAGRPVRGERPDEAGAPPEGDRRRREREPVDERLLVARQPARVAGRLAVSPAGRSSPPVRSRGGSVANCQFTKRAPASWSRSSARPTTAGWSARRIPVPGALVQFSSVIQSCGSGPPRRRPAARASPRSVCTFGARSASAMSSGLRAGRSGSPTDSGCSASASNGSGAPHRSR